MKLKITFLSVCASFLMNAQILDKNGLNTDRLPGTTFKFNVESFKKSVEGSRRKTIKVSNQSITLPLIDGSRQEFILSENNLLSTRLNNIITFDGYSKDRKSKIKLTLADNKMTAMIKSGDGYFIIEPYKTNTGEYRIYNSFEMFGENFTCKTHKSEFEENLRAVAEKLNTDKSVTGFPYGNTMRVFRLAVATTGEFTTAFGNQDAALGEVVAMVNLINQIYESELSVSFQLIEKTLNKTLIFTDGSTDPFTIDPNFASSTNSQVGFTTMNTNGTLVHADYDIGHTFNIMPGTVGGGRGEAAPQPCNAPIKARAWSEWVVTAPKSMMVNLIVHEMGHQFGAGHTFNAMGGYPSYGEACTDQWSFNSAVEPGAGSTIMGYGTNCSVPVNQTNSGRNNLDYFHARSLDQILNTLKFNSTCYNSVIIDNTPPFASAGNTAVSIPKNTPFKLKGIGSDAEDQNLSYTWDQVDIATVYDKGGFGNAINGLSGLPSVNSTTAPLFRSEQSTKTTERYFPKMRFVLDNQNIPPVNAAEALSLVPRIIKMRFTVRDNSVVSGGVDSDQVLVTVTDQGPLSVTYPNSNITSNTGANMNVTWSVNQTDVLKNTVNILLSTDGGVTFPYVLASDVPNNGSAAVVLPSVNYTNRARIKVTAVINEFAEFFDVSDTNFTIDTDCKVYPSVIVESKKEFTAIQGSPEANLNLEPQTPANQTYNSKSLSFLAGNMISLPLYIYNQAMTAPYAVLASTALLPVRFKVTETGNYALSWTDLNSKILVPTIYKGNQVLAANFISSSGVYLGTGTSFSFLGYLGAYLEKGVEYYMTVKNIYNVPVGQSADLSIDGVGQFYNIIDSPAGINYTYIAVNTVTNSIAGTSATANFTTLPLGTYTVYGVSFTGIESSLMNKTIAELNQAGICYQLSENNIILKITSTLVTKEAIKKQIGIAPNPVKDILNVGSDEKITHYEIYDVSGKLIESNIMTNPQINFSRFKTGVYMLKLLNNKVLIHQSKIIKE
ncbi:zinc-dependent metalloprotease [Chryseobacterium sp. G0162]|uniref:zinc-dependent metalloprotease n=1 Tax=Chryseobacterium sp. G0162 TaxID=2487063 RepID=UPI0013DE0FFA|nr:zinc-dependent metalloprotease [Chryseobacterium sp. G0162]